LGGEQESGGVRFELRRLAIRSRALVRVSLPSTEGSDMSLAEPTGVAEEGADIVKRYLAALGRNDYAAMSELLADDLKHDFSRDGVDVDLSGNNTIGLSQEVGTGGVDVTIHDVFGHGDKVATRFSLAVSGDAVDGAPSNASTSVSALAIVRIHDGKIAEVHHEMNTLGMLLDLGWSVEKPAG
jgi:ketosteroid isomerase-like protein